MSKSRLEWRVGLFVFLGLALLAGLLVEFSKGLTFFQPTYTISLRASNVGGLKTRAAVQMSGFQVGTVSDIQLAPDGKSVTIKLTLFKRYEIHKDAEFIIDQSGFLGDQYVAIQPTKNEKEPFKDGDQAEAQAPFNLQEFTRSATGFIQRIDETVKKLDEALDNVTRLVLNPETLTNLAVAISNLRGFSEHAQSLADNLNGLVNSNSPAIYHSASNLVVFSDRLNQFGDGLNGILSTNRDAIQLAVSNVESSSETLKSLLSGVSEGRGLAGELLKDERVSKNVAQIVQNLSITTSNLNRLGVWGVLWQHKPPKTREPGPPQPLRTPKSLSEQ
ncbi:MAG TPA: MlaD family protein [Verrucomicrobiae bacterium]|nr:MlaD family protein [Verrucomicrobiae bacterium]